MTFLLTRWRLIASLLGLLGASFVLWRIHDALAEQRVRQALEAVQKQAEIETRKQVEDEKREQDQQRHDARTSEAARREVRRVDSVGDGWSNCPPVPADFARMLNAIGKEPSAGGTSGSLPSEATVSREGNDGS